MNLNDDAIKQYKKNIGIIKEYKGSLNLINEMSWPTLRTLRMIVKSQITSTLTWSLRRSTMKKRQSWYRKSFCKLSEI